MLTVNLFGQADQIKDVFRCALASFALIKTRVWPFLMYYSPLTICLVLYPIGMYCVVTQVIPAQMCTLHNLILIEDLNSRSWSYIHIS